MNRHHLMRTCGVLLVSLAMACGAAQARSKGKTGGTSKGSARDVAFRAMQDELQRNVKRLKLDELEPPFFVSYDLRDVEILQVSATLGALVRASHRPMRDNGIRLMVGSYERNDENFLDFSSGAAGHSRGHGDASLPLENDYQGIRRALWVSTDSVYKHAAETLERKRAAMEQQRVPEELAKLPDYARVPVATTLLPRRSFPIDVERWKKTVRDLSAVFREFPEVYSSGVELTVLLGEVFLVNSEGMKVAQPVSYVGLRAIASTQATDGEPVRDQLAFHALTPAEMPSVKSLLGSVRGLAQHVTALRNAPRFEESYAGPVLFEGQAAAELLVQRMLSGSQGLLAYRRPIVSDARASAFLSRMEGEPLTDRLGKRILPRDVSVRAQPRRTEALGRKLIGAIEVDADGVVPAEEIVLVRDGILEALLSNRIPTPATKTSNGHERLIVGMGGVSGNGLAPTVVEVTSSKGRTAKKLRQELLALAEDDGLEHVLIVRRLAAGGGSSGAEGPSLSAPIELFRLDVKTGKETLVRSAKLGAVGLTALRRIAGMSKELQVYNTLVSPGRAGGGMFGGGGGRQGAPASLIGPEAILLEELEVVEHKRDYTPTLPVVPSPLAEK